VQDAWKATPKLSVDLGIRFSTYTHFVQKEEASAFSLERFDPAKAPLLYAPALVNGVRVARNPRTGETAPAVLIGGLVPGTGDITNGMVLKTDPKRRQLERHQSLVAKSRGNRTGGNGVVNPNATDPNFIAFEPMASLSNGLNLAHKGLYKAQQYVRPGATWTATFWVKPSGF
jgi:hypothetical protein